MVAGETNTGLVTFTGMAPRAFLGNYRIFGSPEVNDTTSDDVILVASEQAMADGMDMITLSLGAPALQDLSTVARSAENPRVPHATL